MYKEILECLSIDELRKNSERLSVAVDDLRDCLDSLLEEKDELVSCNDMFKITIEQYKLLEKLDEFKIAPNTDPVGEINSRENFREQVEEKKEVWTEIIEDDIQMPKTARFMKSEKPLVPKLKLSRPSFKKIVR